MDATQTQTPKQPPVQPSLARDNPPPASNYEATFDITGYGKLSRLALLSSSLILLHAFIETVGMAYVITPAECDLGLSVVQKGIINSATFIGIIATAICWGSASDRYGRRTVMMPAIFGAVVFSFASSLCSTFGLLLLFRLITGVLISASSATILVYLGELNISSHRDKAIAYAITSVAAVFCVVPAIAWAIVPGKWYFSMFGLTVRPWRVFMWMWGLCGSVGLGLMCILPESPSYVFALKGGVFTLPIMAKMYAWNTGKDASDFPVTTLRCESIMLHAESRGLMQSLRLMTQLVRAPLRRPILISHYCMFNVFLTANGLYIWLPDIINEILHDVARPSSICATIVKKYGEDTKKNETDKDGNKVCEEINTMMYPLSIAMECFFFIFFIIISQVINKFDKRKLNAAVMLPCALALALCSVIPQLTVAGILLAIGVNTGSVVCLLSAMAVDVFPTSVRALAMCTLFMCGQLGGAIGSNLLSISLSGCEVVFFAVAINIVVSVFILYKFWPDPVALRSAMEAKGMTY